MMKIILSFIFFFSAFHALAEVIIGNQYFSDQEIAALENTLSVKADPSFGELEDIAKNMDLVLLNKILALGNDEQTVFDSIDLKKFNSIHTSWENTKKTELISIFMNALAIEVIDMLRVNKKLHVRLLARDMGPVFRTVQWLLQNNNQTIDLSVDERLDLLKRMDYVLASRDMVSSIRSEQEAHALLNININSNEEYVLLDAGYGGTIAKMLSSFLRPLQDQNRLHWKYVWKAQTAPAFVQLWGQKFFEMLKENYPNMDIDNFRNMAEIGSFRVAIYEHMPKTIGGFIGHKDTSLYLMLDIDDTVLKEVEFKKYKNHPNVQILNYIPSPNVLKKYIERLQQSEPGKVIHYQIDTNGSIQSTVTVRPAFADLISSLDGYIRSGLVKLVVTSNNDVQRTEAVVKQLKIGESTLLEREAMIVSPDVFNNDQGNKDITLVRRLAKIPDTSSVIAIDDLPQKIQKSTFNDRIYSVSPFSGSIVEQSLITPPSSNLLIDDFNEMQRLLEIIKQQLTVQKTISITEKIRGLAVQFKLFGIQKRLTPIVKSDANGGMCRSIFIKAAI